MLHQPGQTSMVITDKKKNKDAIPLQLNSGGIHSVQKSWGSGLYASSSSEGAVELQQADLGMWKCARQDRPGWAGLGRAAEVPLRPE